MVRKSPMDYLMIHQTIVLSVYRQNDKKPKKTWEDLQNHLPELSKIMSVSTFKQYISVFGLLLEKLDKVRRKLDKVSKNGDRLDVDFELVRQELDSSPKRISGWNLRKSKDGYYRCYRKINAKLHSIYLGKVFDPNKAQNLIIEKERKIGLDRG